MYLSMSNIEYFSLSKRQNPPVFSEELKYVLKEKKMFKNRFWNKNWDYVNEEYFNELARFTGEYNKLE